MKILNHTILKRTICRWIVSFLFVYVTRLVSLASCLNMASLADDVYYKLLDEVKYVALIPCAHERLD